MRFKKSSYIQFKTVFFYKGLKKFDFSIFSVPKTVSIFGFTVFLVCRYDFDDYENSLDMANEYA